ncbi:putative metalloenzyme YecM [Mucilaginibacter sp. UYCu711]
MDNGIKLFFTVLVLFVMLLIFVYRKAKTITERMATNMSEKSANWIGLQVNRDKTKQTHSTQ